MWPKWGGSLPLRSWQSRGETIFHPSIHPSNKYLLHAYYVLRAILVARDNGMNR